MNLNPIALVRALTYRNDLTRPDAADGLHITTRRGRRTVRHPDIPLYLETRRRRVLVEGLDDIDRALLDPDSVTLLHASDALLRHDTAHIAITAERVLVFSNAAATR